MSGREEEAPLGTIARIALAFAATTLGSACGGGDDTNASPASGASSSTGGSGGTCAAGDTNGGGSGGTSRTGGGSGSGGEPTPQTCDVQEGRVSVGDQLFTFPLIRAVNISSANPNTEQWVWSSAIGDYGFFRLSGSDATMGQTGQPVEGSPLTIDHAVLAPDIGDTLGVMYGVAPGSGSELVRDGDQIAIHLQNVATLADCGDFPAAGELDLCYRTDGSPCPAEEQGGSLEGYQWTDEITSWTLTDGDLRASVGSQGANLRARMDAAGLGPIQWAYMSTSIYGRYDGKLLCAGEGSEVVAMSDSIGDYLVVHLRTLGWLEGPGSGRASGCVR